MQRIAADRKARLGNEYGRWYDDQGCLIPDVNIPQLLPTRDIEPNERIAAVPMFPDVKQLKVGRFLGITVAEPTSTTFAANSWNGNGRYRRDQLMTSSY